MKLICCDKCGKEIKDRDMITEALLLAPKEQLWVELCFECSDEINEKRNEAEIKISTEFYANFKYKKENKE